MCASESSAPELADLLRTGRFLRAFVTDRRSCARPLPAQVEYLAAQGLIDAVVLREKDLDEVAYGHLADEVAAACTRCSVAFVAHSHALAALPEGRGSLHLPLPLLLAGGRPPGIACVGTNVHDVAEVASAEDAGADYLVASPVFAPSCKPVSGRGLAFLRSVVETARVPVFALGGVTDGTEPAVRACKAAGAWRMGDYCRR